MFQHVYSYEQHVCFWIFQNDILLFNGSVCVFTQSNNIFFLTCHLVVRCSAALCSYIFFAINMLFLLWNRHCRLIIPAALNNFESSNLPLYGQVLCCSPHLNISALIRSPYDFYFILNPHKFQRCIFIHRLLFQIRFDMDQMFTILSIIQK